MSCHLCPPPPVPARGGCIPSSVWRLSGVAPGHREVSSWLTHFEGHLDLLCSDSGSFSGTIGSPHPLSSRFQAQGRQYCAHGDRLRPHYDPDAAVRCCSWMIVCIWIAHPREYVHIVSIPTAHTRRPQRTRRFSTMPSLAVPCGARHHSQTRE